MNEKRLKATEELILRIQESEYPISLSGYISRGLSEGWLSLYEGYILNSEEICLMKGKGKGFWRTPVYISTCLKILNQRMLAILYDDTEYAVQLKKIGLEAMRLNQEKRKHLILDDYLSYLECEKNEKLLRRIEYTRDFFEQIIADNYDDGPCTVESFPYEYCAPEKLLLSDNPKLVKTPIGDDIQDIIVEIGLKW